MLADRDGPRRRSRRAVGRPRRRWDFNTSAAADRRGKSKLATTLALLAVEACALAGSNFVVVSWLASALRIVHVMDDRRQREQHT